MILTDASLYAAGYFLVIEEYTTDQNGKHYKTYDTLSFGSNKLFNPTYLKLSFYAEEFLAVHFAFDTFEHILWGSSKPVVILSDNKCLTRFFQAKTIPSFLWTCVDQLSNFLFSPRTYPWQGRCSRGLFVSNPHPPPYEIRTSF